MKERELFKNTSRVKEERYNYAVGVAADLFLERGIDSVKMTDIAENCGIGVASLYRFFETKTEIVIRAGIILWGRVNQAFMEYILKDESVTGLDCLVYYLGFFKIMFNTNKNFIKFLADFDKLILEEEVPASHLESYEKSIVNFYDPICKAYEKGLNDGTIREVDDLRIFYASITHSLMALSQKFIRGAILPGDKNELAEKEIDKLLEMTARYLAA